MQTIGNYGKSRCKLSTSASEQGFNIENDRLRIVLGDVFAEFFVRTSQANRENRKVGAQPAGKRVSDGRIFFEKNDTLSHKSPVFFNRR